MPGKSRSAVLARWLDTAPTANLGTRADDVSPWRHLADALAAARIYE